jgi:hypothetical protein
MHAERKKGNGRNMNSFCNHALQIPGRAEPEKHRSDGDGIHNRWMCLSTILFQIPFI